MLSRNYEIYSCINKVTVRLKFTIMRNSHILRYKVPIVIEKKSQLSSIVRYKAAIMTNYENK